MPASPSGWTGQPLPWAANSDEGVAEALTNAIEHSRARRIATRELLSDRTGGIGYLLKDRVAEVREFVEAVRRVAGGGTVMDPEVVGQLINGGRRNQLAGLTPREREVLAVMAEGRSNAAIAARLVIAEKAVSKHINNIFAKLGLPPSDDDHRRVLAVLAYLGG